jgi:hypothetical protein
MNSDVWIFPNSAFTELKYDSLRSKMHIFYMYKCCYAEWEIPSRSALVLHIDPVGYAPYRTSTFRCPKCKIVDKTMLSDLRG